MRCRASAEARHLPSRPTCHSPGNEGKLHEGTLPVPVNLVTVTPVPDGDRLVLETAMLAFFAVTFVTSSWTFSSVRPSGKLELKPSSVEEALDTLLTDFMPLTTMFWKLGISDPVALV